MKIEQFNLARQIRGLIDEVNTAKSQLRKMKIREEDEEFNEALKLAQSATSYSITRLEEDFDNL